MKAQAGSFQASLKDLSLMNLRQLALLAPLVAAACAGGSAPIPLEAERTVAAPPEVVRQRVEQVLRGLGLSPVAGIAGLEADLGSPGLRGWAFCPMRLVHDRTVDVRRADWAEAGASDGILSVTFRPVGEGTHVRVAMRSAATYRDIYRNLPVGGACRSTGEIERRVLEAAGGAA
jgi:hypothetical protein